VFDAPEKLPLSSGAVAMMVGACHHAGIVDTHSPCLLNYIESRLVSWRHSEGVSTGTGHKPAIPGLLLVEGDVEK
jgi:hypothetical protein